MPDEADSAVRASVFLNKGGVSKTTTTAHFGVALAEAGHDVLLIDLAGKQNDLAKQFGVLEEIEQTPADDRWPNISTVFSDDWENVMQVADVEEMIHETDEGPDLIPAHPGLDGVDDRLASVDLEDRFDYLDDALTNDIEPLGYDIVLLDLPGLTNNVTLNCLLATRAVWTPVELGDFEERQVDALLSDLDEIEESLGATVDLSMVVPSRVDRRQTLDQDLLDDLGERYPDRIAPVAVPQSQDVRNAQRDGQTIFGLEGPSTTAERAQSAYQQNAAELFDRLVTHE